MKYTHISLNSNSVILIPISIKSTQTLVEHSIYISDLVGKVIIVINLRYINRIFSPSCN